MRTTITFDADVAAALEDLRRRDGEGISATVNSLVRAGLSRRKATKPYVHRSEDLGAMVDVSNIGEALALLDEQ